MNRVATYYRLMEPEQIVRFAVLVKGHERYVFSWDDDEDSRRQMLRTAGRWASDARLSFTWADAARLSNIVRSKG